MDRKESQIAAINKMIINTIIIIIVAATLGNSVAVLKGEKPVYIAILFTSLGIAVSSNLILRYKKSPACMSIKLHGFYGFFLIYLFAVFTTTNNICFVYILPILYMYTLYHDVKLMRQMTIITVIANFIMVGWYYSEIGLGLNDSSELIKYIVQLIAIVVVACTCVIATKVTKQFNEEDMNEIMEAQAKQEVILNEVLQIGGILENKSQEMHHIVDQLKDSAGQMDQAMDAMSVGVEKATENVFAQENLTKDIQSIIAITSEQAKSMDEISEATIKQMGEGQAIVQQLTHNTEAMNTSGKQVNEAMVALKDKTNAIDKITETITTIAKEINILSLNATIESARAGEAGKGFAVVATEIGKLASQTSTSIVDISKILGELQGTVEVAFEALTSFSTANSQQNDLIQSTESIFKVTNDNIGEVSSKVSDVTHKIEDILLKSNEIIQSIEIVSTESKQSMTHIDVTSATVKENLLNVEQTKQIANELRNTAESLKKYN